ncbi:hypothetical protein RBA29_003680 [Cronobacter turicensis]|nr:hypothetical protein [Cronobacter turicensis]EKY3213185.1 hypothetical protein [Cronobacter turicensis]EKY3217088.1 hypothetical protein [Cronobacter turicensis]
MKKFLVMLLFFSVSAMAGKYPVVTSITPEFDGTNGIQYSYHFKLTQALVEIGPASEQVAPSSMGTVFLGTKEGATQMVDSSTIYHTQQGFITIGEAARNLYLVQGQKIDSIYHTGNKLTNDDCAGYFYTANFSHTLTLMPWSSIIAPAGCVNIPPIEQWCKITTPELQFDHGTITLSDAEGSSVTKNMNVECVDDMAVSFKLMSNDSYIYLDDGKAEIKVNDRALGSKIDLPAGQSVVTVKDLLTGMTSEGAHTGSSVLIMMPY